MSTNFEKREEDRSTKKLTFLSTLTRCDNKLVRFKPNKFIQNKKHLTMKNIYGYIKENKKIIAMFKIVEILRKKKASVV